MSELGASLVNALSHIASRDVRVSCDIDGYSQVGGREGLRNSAGSALAAVCQQPTPAYRSSVL